MKKVILIFLCIASLSACKETPQQASTSSTTASTDTAKLQNSPDLAAITDVIHNFYKWYDDFQKKDNASFINSKGKHVKLDLPKLDAYLANFKNSGFVSASFIENEKAYYKKCETIWQTEENDGPPTGLDADKYFCAQDWEIQFWTTSPVTAEGLGTDKVRATMSGTEGGAPKSQKFDLVKENGKWLISNIECDMGVGESAAVTPEQKLIESLAAFYKGTLPCSDCDGVETLLTLNADAKRTFTLEEQFNGKKSKTIESAGTWTVANGVVTLNGKTAASKYEITKDGLISFNTNGSKRDAASAKKYLLKKVLGE